MFKTMPTSSETISQLSTKEEVLTPGSRFLNKLNKRFSNQLIEYRIWCCPRLDNSETREILVKSKINYTESYVCIKNNSTNAKYHAEM